MNGKATVTQKTQSKALRGKLNPELVGSVVSYITAGHSYYAACQGAGINRRTAIRWKQRGEKGEKPYSGFMKACQQAEHRWLDDLLKPLNLDTDIVLDRLSKNLPIVELPPDLEAVK